MTNHKNGLAVAVLQWATGLYPPEKRAWGEAILAESFEVSGGAAKFWWTLGGLNMALRAFLTNLLGSGSKRPSLDGPQVAAPIRWKRMIVCLTVAAALLLVPDFREGLNLVVDSWRGYRSIDMTQWRETAREAEAKGDAEGMVYAAMVLPFDEGMPLAQRAVAKDPSLTWAYYFVRPSWFPSTGAPHERRIELLKALSKWDPDNAVPYLAMAVNLSSAGEAYKDAKWLEAMNQAVTAKSYDSYFARRLALQRKVNHAPDVSNTLDNLTSYWIQMPYVSSMNPYAAFLQQSGETASTHDQREQAARQLWALANLYSLMHVKAMSFGEKYEAMQMQEVTLAHLQPLLVKLGETQEAQTAGYIAGLDAEQYATSTPRATLDDPFVVVSAASAHLLVIWIALCCSLLIVAGAIFAGRRKAGGFSRMVFDHLPLALLAGCVGFLAVSYPYAQAAKAFVTNPFDFEAIMHVASLRLDGVFYINWFLFPKALVFWWGMIGIGTVMCLWLGSRAMRRQTV